MSSYPPSGAAGGDLSGSTYPNPIVANGAISAAKIAAGVIPTTLPPSGPAGGSLAGTYPNPTLAPGVVTWTETNLQTYARVGRSVNPQALTSSTFTYLIFDTIGVNVGGMYSAASPDRFTIQQAGFYIFGAGATFALSTGGEARLLRLYGGGAQLAQVNVTKQVNYGMDIAIVTGNYLGAGNLVQVMGYQDSGAALNVTLAYLWISRVS
jgi:hypothetical protein